MGESSIGWLHPPARGQIAPHGAGSVPVGAPPCAGCEGTVFEGSTCERCGDVAELVPLPGGELGRVLHLAHGKGEDPREWPADLRVQEWPDGSAYTFEEAA